MCFLWGPSGPRIEAASPLPLFDSRTKRMLRWTELICVVCFPFVWDGMFPHVQPLFWFVPLQNPS